jgi:hypothetical protein
MPEVIECPQCGRKLRVADDLVGRRAKCPACRYSFVAQPIRSQPPPVEDEPPRPAVSKPSRHAAELFAEPPPVPAKRRAVPPPLDDEDEEEAPPPPRHRAEEDEYEEEERGAPRRPRRRTKAVFKEEWEQVRRGLGMILAAIAIMLGTGVLIFAGYLLIMFVFAASVAAAASQQQRQQPQDPAAVLETALGAGGVIAIVLVLVFIVGGLTALIADFIGLVNCCAAPDKNMANTLARAALWMAIASLVMPFITCLVEFAIFGTALFAFQGGSTEGGVVAVGVGTVISWLLNIVTVLLNVGSFFTFLFFLRAVAVSVRSPGLAQSIVALIITAGVVVLMGMGTWGIAFLFNLGAHATGSQGPGASLVPALGCCDMFLGVGSWVWYVVTLFLVRAAITRYVEGRA